MDSFDYEKLENDFNQNARAEQRITLQCQMSKKCDIVDTTAIDITKNLGVHSAEHNLPAIPVPVVPINYHSASINFSYDWCTHYSDFHLSGYFRPERILKVPPILSNAMNREIALAIVEQYFLQLTDEEVYCMLGNVVYSQLRSESVFVYISRHYNMEIIQALLNLARYLSIKMEYLFTTYTPTATMYLARVHRHINNRILRQLVIKDCVYRLTACDEQYGFDEVIEQSVCTYTCGSSRFHLVATVSELEGRFELGFGLAPINAKLLSHVEIDRSSEAIVFIFLNLSTALEMRRMARDTNLFESANNIIMSGYYGGMNSVTKLDTAVCFGRTFLIIPEVTLDSLKEAEVLQEVLIKAGARDVQFFLGVIQTCADGNAHELSNMPSWMKSFYENIITISYNRVFHYTIEEIGTRAKTYTEYQKWKQIHALCPTEEQKTLKNNDTFHTVPFRAISDGCHSRVQSVDIYDFCRDSDTVFLWGPSNVGKTWVVLTLCVALVLNISVFCFSRRQNFQSTRKVLCLLGEEKPKDASLRIMQLSSEHAQLEDNIVFTSLKSGLTLRDGDIQKQLLTYIKEHGVNTLILDNILSLVSDATSSQVKIIHEFIKMLKANGTSVIVVHHASKEGDTYLVDP